MTLIISLTVRYVMYWYILLHQSKSINSIECNLLYQWVTSKQIHKLVYPIIKLILISAYKTVRKTWSMKTIRFIDSSLSINVVQILYLFLPDTLQIYFSCRANQSRILNLGGRKKYEETEQSKIRKLYFKFFFRRLKEGMSIMVFHQCNSFVI